MRCASIDDTFFGKPPPDPGSRAPKAGNGSARKSTLLVVEDEILTRLATADFLRSSGYRVLEASNAHEAVAIFAAGEPIELILTDSSMPGPMDGAALAQWVRGQFPDVKIIIASDGSPGNDTRGAPAITMQKPYALHSLLAYVNRLLAH